MQSDRSETITFSQPQDWVFSNSGRALALPATDAAVLGTSALYGRQLHAQW
jgi:hypothetical protein